MDGCMSINNRYDFVYFFYVKDGNPNGDPDSGNMPRVDIETGHGLVTDVCLKRKIRNYIGLKMGNVPPYEIYVREKAILNNQHARAYAATGLTQEMCGQTKKTQDSIIIVDEVKKWMCSNFYDIRTFGAVMSTNINCGQVKGPIQIAFSRSIEPIFIQEHTITRCAVMTVSQAEKQSGENRMMGKKYTIPFAIYRCHGHISAHFSQQTGFNETDLALFWESLINMFNIDHSAAKGEMGPCALYVFKHDSSLGNAPAHKLFEIIKTTHTSTLPLRDIKDCEFSIDIESLPKGVTVNCLYG